MKTHPAFPRSKATIRCLLSVAVFLGGLFTQVSAEAQSCQKSTDCPGIMVCEEGACRKAGSTGPAPHALCTADSQCGTGKTCQDGTCVAETPSSTVDPVPAEGSVPPPGMLGTEPDKPDKDAEAPPPGAPEASSSTQSFQLASLQAERENVSLVAPILLLSIGAAVMLQGGVLIAMNDGVGDSSNTLTTAGAVILGAGGITFASGAILLPLRLSKRRSLDAQIEALEAQQTSFGLSPIVYPETRFSPALYGASVSGRF